ncbi:MAG: PorT family protein [Paludibacter sp.]|nr:PorT family protein [Paludibacter sp.]
MKRFFTINVFIILLTVNAFSQIGIRIGVNSAQQIRTFIDHPANFTTDKLTGFQAGLVWQSKFGKSGFGTEIGALFTQKGSFYNYTDNSISVEKFDELNYVSVPFNIRFMPPISSPVNLYGTGGIYFSYLLSGKTTDETNNSSEKMTFRSVTERMDVGVSAGGGVQLLGKIQLGITWNWGFMHTPLSTSDFIKNFKNRDFSVNLTYVF